MRGILTYHSIDASGSAISCHPDAFDRHVAWLASKRVRVTMIDELLALPSTEDGVAITFDDAFENFDEIAAPRLLRLGLPVTVFVVADRTGATNAWNGHRTPGIPLLPLLDWPALLRLQRAGVALGAHSRRHPDLTRLDGAALDDEIRGSAEIMETRTGTRPTVFAYPYGRVDAQAAAAVAAAFPCACTTEFRALDDTAVRSRLPRLDMYYFQKAGHLEQWGTPDFERFIARRRRLRRLRAAGEAARGMLSLRTPR